MWKVLIVDDSLADLAFMQEILKGSADTYLAMNGREAITGYHCALEQKKPFDLILLDMVMPEMDGFQVLTQVREEEKKAGVPTGGNMPIIMVTAHEKPFMKQFNGRWDDYMLKPVDVDGLLQKIRSKLKK